MKYFAALAVLALVAEASASSGPVDSLHGRAFNGGKGNQGGNKNNNGGGNKNGGGNGGNAGKTNNTAAAPPPANTGNLQQTIEAALATTLQAQIQLFDENQALVKGNTTGQFNDNNGGQGSNSVSQTSLTVDPSQIQVGAAFDGQTQPGAEGGQAAALTSKDNFVNFCATQKAPLQNGLQFRGQASCNPTPMGMLPSSDNTPISEITSPQNGANIKTGSVINFQAKISNMELGSFSNAQSTYYGSPQVLNAQGQIVGHTHITVSPVGDLPNFVFFKGINAPPFNGVLTATAATGLFAGEFRVCTMTAASTHQPVLVNVAQRAGQDDCIRFTVSDNGDANAGTGDASAASQTAAFLAKAAADFAAANGSAAEASGDSGTTASASDAGTAASSTASAAESSSSSSGNNGKNNGKGQNIGKGQKGGAPAATSAAAATTSAASNSKGNGKGNAATSAAAPPSGQNGAKSGNRFGGKGRAGGRMQRHQARLARH